MTRSASGARRSAGPWTPPAFPRPAGSFAGRRAEIDRILARLEDDVAFFVYGVGGIGKSELVFQAIEEARARPRWREAIPVLVDVRPGATIARTLARLLAATGAAPEPRRGHASDDAHASEQLAALARALDARPYLVFLDDVHHLPSRPIAEALATLSGELGRSRLFVASRQQLRLPALPQPLVTTLGPLDARAAEQMMDALAERMQLPRPDPERMMRHTHGSPFHVRRMLVRHDSDADSLDESLRALPPAARRVLVAAAVARHRPTVASLRSACAEVGSFDDALRELVRRFLVDDAQGRLVVHDLIREALLDQVEPEELAAGHRAAAASCLAHLDGDGPPSLILAVDAATHCLAAGCPGDAWALIERWHSALAAAGSDHLLLEPLEELRRALPARSVAVELVIARCLVRASQIEEADGVLARVGEQRTPTEDARYWALSGEIAQRRGELSRAEVLFARAAERAPNEAARFQVRLQRATVAVFRGEGGRARQELAAALMQLPSPTPRQRARCGWVRTVSWMFDERYERAADEARRTREEVAGAGLSDLVSRLAMLETLACIEHDDMERARAVSRLIETAGLRWRVAALYRAITAYAGGDVRRASVELVAAHEYMRAHGDTVNAYIAGYYGSAALGALGKIGEAQKLAERTSELARRAGLAGAAAQSMAQQAMLAAEAVQAPVAHRLVGDVLAGEHIGPRTRATAHRARARAYVLEGDIARALEQHELARAAVAAPDLEAARYALDVEHAVADLIGGNLERAVEYAERAVEHYRGCAREYETAHAQIVLAAAYLARGKRTDIVFAEKTIAAARELGDRGELRSIQVACVILAAALARRSHRDRAGRALLADALRELDPERGSLYAATLLAAMEGGAAAAAAPGGVALLAHLGFTQAVDCYLVDRIGRRAATDEDARRERTTRELFVDEGRSVIAARRGGVEIRGRAMQCALLSVLVQARGEPVEPETLYRRVWGVAEYEPLRHRNALYVAINRLRTSLREALPERDVIERVASGWRLADGIDACAAVAVRERAKR